MSEPITEGTAIQLSGRDPDGHWILSVLAKRTYIVVPSGECVLATQQLPLVQEPIHAEGDETLLLADIDTWPFKPMTDVIVHGHAYNHPGQAVFDASVKIGHTIKAVRVFGDRRATLAADGRILFSKPTKLDKVPLSYAFAYGGRDEVTEREFGNPAEAMKSFLPSPDGADLSAAASIFLYPRNQSGRGYVVDRKKEAIEAAVLPNLEHPADPLTPERFVAGDPWRWLTQPLPASLGWMDYGYFPRIAWMGVFPDCDLPEDLDAVGELRFGHATRALFEEKTGSEPDFASTNGASLGLRLPYLHGGDTIELVNLTPSRPSFRFKLPSERPRLAADGRNGKLIETEPVIHSVVFEADISRLTVVWRGAARALRAYLNRELSSMPFRVKW
jgi:hypothetical protein